MGSHPPPLQASQSLSDRRSPTDTTGIVIARTPSNRHCGRLDGWHPTKQPRSDVWGHTLPSPVSPPCPLGCSTSNHAVARSQHVVNVDPFPHGGACNDATDSPSRRAAIPVIAAVASRVQWRPTERSRRCIRGRRRTLPHSTGCCRRQLTVFALDPRPSTPWSGPCIPGPRNDVPGHNATTTLPNVSPPLVACNTATLWDGIGTAIGHALSSASSSHQPYPGHFMSYSTIYICITVVAGRPCCKGQGTCIYI